MGGSHRQRPQPSFLSQEGDRGSHESQHRAILLQSVRVPVGVVSHCAGYFTQTVLVNATETLENGFSGLHVRNPSSRGRE